MQQWAMPHHSHNFLVRYASQFSSRFSSLFPSRYRAWATVHALFARLLNVVRWAALFVT